MTETLSCPQGGCSNMADVSKAIADLMDGQNDMRQHLVGYEDRFASHVAKFEAHMDNEEIFAAKLGKSIDDLADEVRNLKTKDATDDAKKEGAFKTIRAVVIVLTLLGAAIGFVWAATDASITFGG